METIQYWSFIFPINNCAQEFNSRKLQMENFIENVANIWLGKVAQVN